MRKLDNRLCNPLMSSWTAQTALGCKALSSVFRQRGMLLSCLVRWLRSSPELTGTQPISLTRPEWDRPDGNAAFWLCRVISNGMTSQKHHLYSVTLQHKRMTDTMTKLQANKQPACCCFESTECGTCPYNPTRPKLNAFQQYWLYKYSKNNILINITVRPKSICSS